MSALTIVGLALFGVFLGAVVGMTAIGNGLLGIPVLILLGVGKYVAVGTVGFAGVFMMASGAYRHHKNGNVDMRISLWFLVASVPMSFFSAAFKESVNAVIDLTYIIAIAIFLSIGVMLDRTIRVRSEPEAESPPPRIGVVPILLIGLAMGFLIGTTSISGSLIFIAFVLALRMSDHRAVGTTNFVAIFSLASASVAHIAHGQVDWPLFAVFTPAVMLGAYIGAQLTHVLPRVWLRLSVLTLLLAAGVSLLVK
ncbi:MAG: sulfite exporter TauE/SafE family protein [Planctomycetota bacterium]